MQTKTSQKQRLVVLISVCLAMPWVLPHRPPLRSLSP